VFIVGVGNTQYGAYDYKRMNLLVQLPKLVLVSGGPGSDGPFDDRLRNRRARVKLVMNASFLIEDELRITPGVQDGHELEVNLRTHMITGGAIRLDWSERREVEVRSF
jgi:hypothetical protein